MTKVILLEFNELCPQLLDKWMVAGYLPNFRNFYKNSQVFTTETDETDPPNLEPWIQWYSIHTGIPYREHRVFHLTDGPRAGYTDIWRILHSYGKRVWNCSSMNASGFEFEGSAFLPDPWCASEPAFPAELDIFRDFVARHVQEYSNPNRSVSVENYVRFVRFMVTHGLRPSTILAIVRQLTHELLSAGKTKWQRVSVLDKLQFDVFRHFFKYIEPDFATFFVNSTAHLQHAYWRHMEPDKFIARPLVREREIYKNAILFGYREMDWLVGEFVKLAKDDTLLIFVSGLSQEPYTKYESIGGHKFYRPKDIAKLFSILSITPNEILPVMTHQYLARFEDEASAQEARNRLSSLTLDGEPVFEFNVSEPKTLYFGNQVHTFVQSGSRIIIAGEHGASIDYYEIFYRLEEIKSGKHNPLGCLWIRTGDARVHEEKASILDILPTVLAMFEIPSEKFVGRPLLENCTAIASRFDQALTSGSGV